MINGIASMFQHANTIEVQISTTSETTPQKNRCWLTLSTDSESTRQRLFFPPTIDSPRRVLFKDPPLKYYWEWTSVNIARIAAAAEDSSWQIDRVDVTFNSAIRNTVLLGDRSIDNSVPSHHAQVSIPIQGASSSWSWELRSAPSAPMVGHPSAGQSVSLIYRIIEDHWNWLHSPSGSEFPVVRYLSAWAENISRHEYVAIFNGPKGGYGARGLPYGFGLVLSAYANAFLVSRHIQDASEQNAIRHAVWQIDLTKTFGRDFAEQLAVAHEAGDRSSPEDERVDRQNNQIAQEAALADSGDTDSLVLARHLWSTGKLSSYSDVWKRDDL